MSRFPDGCPARALRRRRCALGPARKPRRYACDHESLDPAAPPSLTSALATRTPPPPRRASEGEGAAAHLRAFGRGASFERRGHTHGSSGERKGPRRAVAAHRRIPAIPRPPRHLREVLRAAARGRARGGSPADRRARPVPPRLRRGQLPRLLRGVRPGHRGRAAPDRVRGGRGAARADARARAPVRARDARGPAARAGPARGPPELALHLRHLRRGRVEPLRLRGDAGGRREPRQDLEPALHPRRLRPRQDAPPPRGRPHDPREAGRRPRRDRLVGALHERLRRRDQEGHARRVPPQVPRVRRVHRRRRPVPRREGEDGGGVLPHLQRAARPPRADRPLERPARRRT